MDTVERLGLSPGGYGVVTLHRPANVDDERILAGLIRALSVVALECPLVFPVHPRTRPLLGKPPPGIRLVEPLGYLDFIALQSDARIVLTDSGGIQEETTVLGVPCLTLRDHTERPITVTQGTNRLVGRDPDTIVAEARAVLSAPPRPRKPTLWDGKAGDRIAHVLLDLPRPMRPTQSAT